MRACPICKKPSEEKFKPFCSIRCADVDLHRWLSESYAVPVKADDDEDGAVGEDGEAAQATNPTNNLKNPKDNA